MLRTPRFPTFLLSKRPLSTSSRLYQEEKNDPNSTPNDPAQRYPDQRAKGASTYRDQYTLENHPAQGGKPARDREPIAGKLDSNDPDAEKTPADKAASVRYKGTDQDPVQGGARKEPDKKTTAQTDEDLRSKMSAHSGDGGEAGIE